tara:strand:+ start:364 stop:543 length:180 start_codon:yes stop_codon:yes gene_type:complete
MAAQAAASACNFRKYDKEADDFALHNMKMHGIDPKEFTKALEIIVERAGIELENGEEGT